MKLPAPITSRTNARVKALRAALSGKARSAGEVAGIEGETLLAEAIQSGVRIETLFLCGGSELLFDDRALRGLGSAEVVVLAADVFDSATETKSPQGIAATFVIPEARELPGEMTVVLAMESLQDPGNVGTLIRSAEAFGADAVVMTPDCANVWSPKVLRASAGSVFRMPMVRASAGELVVMLRGRGCRMLAAVAGEGVSELGHADLAHSCAVWIGNEGAGLSAPVLAACDERITIPCATESLNAAVAGSVLLYEAMRQRLLQDGGKNR